MKDTKKNSKFEGFGFDKLKKIVLPKYFADEPLFYHPDDCKCQECEHIREVLRNREQQ